VILVKHRSNILTERKVEPIVPGKDKSEENEISNNDSSEEDMNDRDPNDNKFMEDLFNMNLKSSRSQKEKGRKDSDVESRESADELLKES
jgi:hypothetical protein